jgi:hypothetical protein
MVSDFFSKVKHVIGYGFSGYRLGFSRKQWILVLDQELDLNCERFFKDTIYIRINYVLNFGFYTDIGLRVGYWILKPL